MGPLVDRREYAGLADCTYLNQASLGLIPRASLEASTRFLTDVAQHGNLRLSDEAEAEILDSLRRPRPSCSVRRWRRSRWWAERARAWASLPGCCRARTVRCSWCRPTSRA